MKLIMSSLYPQQIKKNLLYHPGDLTVGIFILVLYETESEKKKKKANIWSPPCPWTSRAVNLDLQVFSTKSSKPFGPFSNFNYLSKD